MKTFHEFVGLVVLITLGLTLAAAPASAHTGFESSNPPDGASLDQPLEEIVIVFSGLAEPTGDGFQVLDASGQLRVPTESSTVDGLTWVLRFEPPLEGGSVGVKWMVKAPDAHPIEGSFSFAVPAIEAVASAPLPPVAGAPDLDSFLVVATDSTSSAEWVGVASRTISLVATMVAIGSLAFAALVLRGARRDVHYVLYWVRRAGAFLAIAAVVEMISHIAAQDGGRWNSLLSISSIGSALFSSFGLAILLRVTGGALLAYGPQILTAQSIDLRDPVVAIKELVGAGVSNGAQERPQQNAAPLFGNGEPFDHPGDHGWSITSGSAAAFGGSAALLLSYLFDGHTVSKGDRLWTSVIDAVHVLGGAIWAGGLIMLAAVMWQRHLRGDDVRALQLAVRFSIVAAGALVVVGAAGLALTVIILDSPSELWTTPWGRLLMAKMALVGFAAAAGGYNHKVLIPEMNTYPDDQKTSAEFRLAVTVEAMILLLAIVVTAFLVVAAS